MTQSFTALGPGALALTAGEPRRRVLITGAAGRIGSYFAAHAHDHYDLRLMVQVMDNAAETLQSFGEVVVADLSDLPRMKEVCQGIDTVVHLAADPSPRAVWAKLLQTNIMGTYNAYVAAKTAGCRRFIFASSIHAVSGYPVDVQVKTSEPVNPGDLYGVSKCFGEALGRYMAEQEGLSTIVIRIGAYQSLDNARNPRSVWMTDCFVSHSDLLQLIQKSIEVENMTFAIFHGVSNNRFKRLDISDARELVGYMPQDDVTAENPLLQTLHLRETLQAHAMSVDGFPSGLRDDL